MPWMIVDEWSFWRRDMAGRAEDLGRCGAWSMGPGVAARPSGGAWGELWHPILQLDWDGLEGGPIARIVARGRFQDPKRSCLALVQAANLPVVETKAGPSIIELRLSAPAIPQSEAARWERAAGKPLDWSKLWRAGA